MVRASRVIVAVPAVALLVCGCTITKTERPDLAGPSELALSLSVNANPDLLVQDGVSQSQIVVLARDQGGQPVKNLPLRFDVSVNTNTLPGRLSLPSAVTDSDGRAVVVYIAPPQYGSQTDLGTIASIGVTPVGTDYASDVRRQVTIRLVPPNVPLSGPIASFAYSPLSPTANALVTFDGSHSGSDVAITEYAWDFGDGFTGSGAVVQHAFAAAGSYVVKLVITDANAKSSAPFKQTITVSAASGSGS